MGPRRQWKKAILIWTAPDGGRWTRSDTSGVQRGCGGVCSRRCVFMQKDELCALVARTLLRFERASSGREARFEACRAITVSARPRLRAIRIATPAARVRVLHFQQIKILFPVGTLLGKRRRTVAHLDPLHAAVIELARVGHVPEILIAGNRSFAERSLVYGARQRICLSGFDASRNKITHADDCTARGTSFDLVW